MAQFSSEDTPFPITQGVTNAIKDTTLLQFYRTISNSTGFKLTVNSTTQQILPNNAYNVMQSELGYVDFKNGNTAVIKKKATYLHTVFVNVYSSSPNSGIVAMDLIYKNGNSLRANAIVSKNITPNSAEPLSLTTIHSHAEGDEIQLRWGGGKVPGGTNLELNIISINWTILEN